MDIFKPFSNILAPGQFQIPSGQCVIDRRHPLANGLVCAFLPAATTTENLASDLVGQSSLIGTGRVATWQNQFIEGAGLFTDNGASSRGITFFGINQSIFAGWTKASLYWRGVPLGNQAAATSSFYIGISYSSGFAGGAPNSIASIKGNGTGSNLVVAAWNNNGTTDTTLAYTNGLTANALISLGAVFDVTGNTVQTYVSGFADTSGAFGAAYGSSGTDRVYFNGFGNNAIGACGYIWNRALTAAEMLWMNRYPYSFFMPAERIMPPLTVAAAPSTVLFRKTASRIGTRIGSRQTWAA